MARAAAVKKPAKKPAAKTTAAKKSANKESIASASAVLDGGRIAQVRVSLHGRAGQVRDWNPDAHSVAVEFDDEPGVFPNIQVAQLTVGA